MNKKGFINCAKYKQKSKLLTVFWRDKQPSNYKSIHTEDEFILEKELVHIDFSARSYKIIFSDSTLRRFNFSKDVDYYITNLAGVELVGTEKDENQRFFLIKRRITSILDSKYSQIKTLSLAVDNHKTHKENYLAMVTGISKEILKLNKEIKELEKKRESDECTTLLNEISKYNSYDDIPYLLKEKIMDLVI